MSDELNGKLAEYLIAMADDELILGHRDSEWCGHAPILEEDIAFANIAIDEIGHAQAWYIVAAKMLREDEETFPDKLVFERPSNLWRCIELVSLPKGDWAFSMLRQFIMDTYELENLTALADSKNILVAELSVKIINEELYHYRHTSEWVKRLGLGTEISNEKMQTALDSIWDFVYQLKESHSYEKELEEAGWVPNSTHVFDAFLEKIASLLQQANLKTSSMKERYFSREEQPKDLYELLEEMQEIPRTYGQLVKW